MPVSSYNIAMTGCGKMGTAMAGAWLKSGLAHGMHILEPNDLPFGHADHHTDPVSFSASLAEADILILAVKPQSMDDLCAALTVPPSLCVLSIAAGKTLSYFSKKFGTSQPIIRAMPNTPAAIGKGITVACSTPAVTDAHRAIADNLLNAMGRVEWVANESLMDAVTAVSGSGPAYVFYLIEALAEAGIKSGLPADLAMSLARETVIGSAALADKESALPASSLRENVTSPNGTTAAALSVLMNGQWQALINEAVAKATARSQELSR
jgi:pyrroline-5-carboxylate reductase